MMLAVICGHLKVAEILLAHGANIQCEDEEGKTPLDYAETESMKLLLRKSMQ